MRKNWLHSFFLSSFAFLFFSPSAWSEIGVTDTTIKIGMTGPATGPTSGNGIALLHGTQALFKRINAAGGIYGRKLELVHIDDGYEPSKAVDAVKRLTKTEKIFSLLTPYGGPSIRAMIPTIISEDLPTVGVIGGSVYIGPERKNVFTVKAPFSDDIEKLINSMIDDLGVKDFAIFYQDDAFGTVGKNAVLKALSQRKLSLKGEGTYKRNTDEIETGLNAVRNSNPKAVLVFALHPASSKFITRAAELGFKPVFAGPIPLASPNLIEAASNLKLNVFIAATLPLITETSVPAVQHFLTDMKTEGFDTKNSYSFEGYFNALVLVEGLRLAGITLTRDIFRTALEKMKDFDVEGVKVHFTPESHLAVAHPRLAEIKNNKLTIIPKLKIE